MPIKIKFILTTYIIILCIIVIFFENKYGEGSYIYIVSILSIVMILGIWIFPEVVTKNKTDDKN